MADKNILNTIEKLTTKLLKLLGFPESKVVLQKKEEAVLVKIDCPEPGVLIGRQGEVISSLQMILGLMVYKKLGHWQKIVVNVDNWLEQREESLKKMALNAAQQVKFSQQSKTLPFLNSAERRIIHLTLADSADVFTESVGEGRERRLVIKPKKTAS